VRSPVTRLPASRRPDGSRAAPDRPSDVGITHMPVVPHEATSRMRGTELFATDRLTIHVYHGRIEIAPGFGLSSATETRPPKAPPVLSPLQALEEVGIPPPSAGPRPRTTSARRPITSSRAGPPARNIWRVGGPARLHTTRGGESPVFTGAGAHHATARTTANDAVVRAVALAALPAWLLPYLARVRRLVSVTNPGSWRGARSFACASVNRSGAHFVLASACPRRALPGRMRNRTVRPIAKYGHVGPAARAWACSVAIVRRWGQRTAPMSPRHSCVGGGPAVNAITKGHPKIRCTSGVGGREIVKVAAHFESIRVLDPADLHRLKAGHSDKPLDSSPVVVGRVDKDSPRWSGSQCPRD
jgi:hypothetical protein